MPLGITVWLVIGIGLSLFLIIVFTINGIQYCKRNNGYGLFLLFLALNIFGLILAISILYNARNGLYKKELEAKNWAKNENRINKDECCQEKENLQDSI